MEHLTPNPSCPTTPLSEELLAPTIPSSTAPQPLTGSAMLGTLEESILPPPLVESASAPQPLSVDSVATASVAWRQSAQDPSYVACAGNKVYDASSHAQLPPSAVFWAEGRASMQPQFQTPVTVAVSREREQLPPPMTKESIAEAASAAAEYVWSRRENGQHSVLSNIMQKTASAGLWTDGQVPMHCNYPQPSAAAEPEQLPFKLQRNGAAASESAATAAEGDNGFQRPQPVSFASGQRYECSEVACQKASAGSLAVEGQAGAMPEAPQSARFGEVTMLGTDGDGEVTGAKLAIRKERNRQSAVASRQRKKDRIKDMERALSSASNANAYLQVRELLRFRELQRMKKDLELSKERELARDRELAMERKLLQEREFSKKRAETRVRQLKMENRGLREKLCKESLRIRELTSQLKEGKAGERIAEKKPNGP